MRTLAAWLVIASLLVLSIAAGQLWSAAGRQVGVREAALQVIVAALVVGAAWYAWHVGQRRGRE